MVYRHGHVAVQHEPHQLGTSLKVGTASSSDLNLYLPPRRPPLQVQLLSPCLTRGAGGLILQIEQVSAIQM